MWDGFFMLVVLCIVMATASFLAGSLPLSLTLSARRLRMITVLGTGVLVGTALVVIIPEGVETLYSSVEVGSEYAERPTVSARALNGTGYRAADIQERRRTLDIPVEIWSRDYGAPPGGLGTIYGGPDTTDADSEETDDPVTPPVNPDMPPPSDEFEEDDSMDDVEAAAAHDPHAWIGPPLILGFILMYLIDTLPKHASSSSQPQRFHISLNQFSFNRTPSVSDPEPTSGHPDTHPSQTSAKPPSATIGLVIHAAADGIALGASSTTTSRLSFVIFLALMIHKAPAAFGLTTVLLKENFSKRAARAHLIVFSLAAPVGAMLTWSLINLFGYGGLPQSLGTEFATGVLLLFSGGTFLYVAMHTMQESGDQSHSHGGVNGYHEVPGGMGMYDPPRHGKDDGKSITDVGIMVVGMLLPISTSFGHGH